MEHISNASVGYTHFRAITSQLQHVSQVHRIRRRCRKRRVHSHTPFASRPRVRCRIPPVILCNSLSRYVVRGSRAEESNDPLRERFDLLVQVVAPFAGLPLTTEHVKAVKTAFIMKNSELAKRSRFSCPSTDEIRRALGIVKVSLYSASGCGV